MLQDATQPLSADDQQIVLWVNDDKKDQPNPYQVDVDASFMKQSDWLEYPPVQYAKQSLRYLIGEIARDHNDIYSMVKRIYLLKKLNDTEKLASAVYDLFYCLEERGESLKFRILDAVSKHLSEQELNYFINEAKNIRYNLPPESMLKTSLLGQGLWGRSDIASKRSAETTSPSQQVSPLVEARELLNQGSVVEAVTILENCLTRSPHDSEISDELFLVYRHMRDYKPIKRMIEILDRHDVAYLDTWRELESRFQREAETL